MKNMCLERLKMKVFEARMEEICAYNNGRYVGTYRV